MIWHVENYEGVEPRHDRPRDGDHVLRQHRLRAADEHRSARRQSRRMARRLGITSQLKGYFSIDARRRGGEPARDGARLRLARERRPADRRQPDRGTSRAPCSRSARRTTRRSRNSALGDERVRDRDPPPAGGRRERHRGGARSSPTAGRSPARPARPRTTATPGSSATRRSSPSPSGSAIRTR